MQTFLPFASFIHSAECLDDSRLNKQIVEAYQILTGRLPNANHPACLMWRGYEFYLQQYAIVCCTAYKLRRGKNHSLYEKIHDIHPEPCDELPFRCNELFHLSNRVNLLRKDAAHYAPLLEWVPTPDLDAYPTGYYWPVEPVGKKAKAGRAAWLKWGKKNGIEG